MIYAVLWVLVGVLVSFVGYRRHRNVFEKFAALYVFFGPLVTLVLICYEMARYDIRVERRKH